VGFLSRIFGPSAVQKAAEGQYRPGPYLLSDGWIPSTWGKEWNWWQNGHSLLPYSQHSAMVEACVSAYAQTIAMCPGDHWRTNANGGRERISNSALSRIVKRPNGYQSMSDFMLNGVRNLYLSGNAYALALRNDRTEISELHLMGEGTARVAETGEVFYQLGGNELIERRIDGPIIVPVRDVLHIRLHTPRHPLKGETPLMAAALDVAAGNAMMQQQLAFFSNQARPSAVLSTDMLLTADQVRELRDRWNEQSQGLSAGGTPILTAGLKPLPLGATAQDAQLAEIMRLTEQHVALAYRVPLQILGIGATTYSSTEQLYQAWLGSGLGFAINHIEEAFGQLFGLKGMPDEYLEFNTAALLRSAQKDRIEALARGVQGGIFTPNEARAVEELPAVQDGDQPRVQQQVVPLDWHGFQEPPTPPAAPAPAAAPVPDDDDEEPADERQFAPEQIAQRLYVLASLH
jgi:HK97 family phage portal protein